MSSFEAMLKQVFPRMSHQKKKSSKPNEKEKDTLFLKAKTDKLNEPYQ
ncbi:hypothetical protein P9F83_09495 [Peribacillus psychrosaccharolyticus]|nr:hypothetical protein [Peribacillus psychrosaccharolyticus]MEC2055462.1 hypothetical protein [Peribacillus psychrosaccharolyticus]